MLRHARHRAIVIVTILTTALAFSGGCVTGPVTPEDFASLVSGAQLLYNVYTDARMELEAFEAQSGADAADRLDELARLEAEAVRLWSIFERFRDIVQSRASTGAQKAMMGADLYQGPMPQ